MLISLKKFIFMVASLLLVEAVVYGANLSLLRGRLFWPPTEEGMAAEIVSWSQRVIDKPLLFRVINSTDGSQHWLVGIVPIGVDISQNFPAASPLLLALQEATVLLSDNINEEDVTQDLHDRFAQQTAALNVVPEGFDLQRELGVKHWSLLRQLLREHPAISDSAKAYYSASLKLKRSHPVDVIDFITTDILRESIEGLVDRMQEQLNTVAIEQGKKIVALASPEQEMEATLAYYTQVRAQANANDVKEIVARGGTKFVMESNLAELDAYFAGDVEALMRNYRQARSTLLRKEDDILVQGRNRTWLANGNIQAHCRTGETCLISVNYIHLFDGKDNLLSLLRKEGFQVERVSAATTPRDQN